MATITLPDDLAERVAPFDRWLPAILEVSLLGLKTPVHVAGADLVTFLSSNPPVEEVLAYRLSSPIQARVDALLERNRQGALSAAEETELDDYLELEHVVRMLKIELSANTPTSV